MYSRLLALVACSAALSLSACGTIDVKSSTNAAGAQHGSGRAGGAVTRGRVDDPRTTKTDHVACLREHDLNVREVGRTDLQILVGGALIRVHFDPTPGVAQGEQIQGRDQSAEVIGSALLYPGNASDANLGTIERCLAQGVSG